MSSLSIWLNAENKAAAKAPGYGPPMPGQHLPSFSILYKDRDAKETGLIDPQWNGSQGQLAKVYAGKYTEEDVEGISAALHERLLASYPDAEGLPHLDEVEIASNAPSLLSDLPWEMTRIAAGVAPSNFDNSLASRALIRSVQATSKVVPHFSRPRLYWSITSPQDQQGLQISTKKFQPMLSGIASQFPLVDVPAELVDDPDATNNLSLGTLANQLRIFKPHIFLLIAHGKNGPDKFGQGYVVMTNGKVRVEELATVLSETESIVVAVLICCDMVRQPPVSSATSAAVQLVRAGIPEVLAIQGSIEQDIAGHFLSEFLHYLLAQHTVPQAAARGRQAIRRHPHAYLPTVFANAERASRQYLRGVFEKYQECLKGAAAWFAEGDDGESLPREDLEKELEAELQKTGLLFVEGPLWSGRSHLLKRVLRKMVGELAAPPPRPLIYIDFDRMQGSSPRDEVARRLEEVSSLLSADTAVEQLPESLEYRVSLGRIVLVMDHFELPEGEQAFWADFFRHVSQQARSLVVVVGSTESYEGTVAHKTFEVSFFDYESTKGYLRRFIPDLLLHSDEVFEHTGGAPMLLDLQKRLSRLRNKRGLKDAMKLTTLESKAFATYADQVLDVLSEGEILTLYGLAFLGEPSSYDLILRFFAMEQASSIETLLDLGVLQADTRRHESLYFVPRTIRNALREYCNKDLDDAARALAKWLDQQVGSDPAREVCAAFSQTGGHAVLLAFQEIMHRANPLDARITAIPILLHQGGSASEKLWRLYAFAHDHCKELFAVEDVLSMAELAQQLGKQEEALDLLEEMDADKLDPFLRVKRWKMRAALWKDVGQHAAIEEIETIYQEALMLARAAVNGEVVTPDFGQSEWRELLVGLLYDYLSYNLFLLKRTTADVGNLIKEIHDIVGDSPSYANLLATLAESELRQDQAEVDWQRVAYYVGSALDILESSKDYRYLSYCHYQYGQYLRLRPDPRLEDAVSQYEQAEQAAKRSGEVRRQAQARRRWVEIRNRRLGDLTNDAAATVLEELIPALREQLQDSLTLRVLVRIYRLRAEIALDAEPPAYENFLALACRIAASQHLTGTSDILICGRLFLDYLEVLKGNDSFAQALNFLVRHKDVIEGRLELTPVNFNVPWQIIGDLREKYANAHA